MNRGQGAEGPRESTMFTHGALYFLVRGGNGALGILTLSVFAHTLTPTQYGTYALVVSASTVVCAIAFNWLSVAVARFYPVYADHPQIVISSATRGFWLATAAVLILGVMALALNVNSGFSNWVILLLVCLAIVHGRYNIIVQIANARSAPFAYGLMTWAKASLSLVSGYLLIVVVDLGERGALLGMVIGAALVVVACDPRWRTPQVSNNAVREMSDRFFGYGLPLTVTFLATMAVDTADRFLIGWMLGVAYVAPYSAAFDLVQQSIGMLLSVMFLAAFPMIVREFQDKDELAVGVRLRQLASAHFAIGIPAATGVALLADDIGIVILGTALADDAARVIPWLSCAILVAAFKSYFLDIPFQLCRRTLTLGYVALGMAAINVIGNLVLIPRFGIVGCAWASIAAFSSGAFASWYFGRSLHSLPWSASDLIKAVIGSLIMALMLGYMSLPPTPISVVFKVIIGGAVYVIVAASLNIWGVRTALTNVFRTLRI